MKKFLKGCLDFICNLFIFFVFWVCVIITLVVCYTFPNVSIIAGVLGALTVIISNITNKK